MLMEQLIKLFSWLKSLPVWLRISLIALIAILSCLLTFSCGQTVKVTVRDTPSGVSISTSQSSSDSAGTSISVNPNINLK